MGKLFLCFALAFLAFVDPASAQISQGTIAAPVGFSMAFITPTIQNKAYAASYSLGGLQTLNVLTASQATLSRIFLQFYSGEKATVTAYIFNRNPIASTCVDNVSFSLDSDDAKHLAAAPILMTPLGAQGAAQTFAEYSFAAHIRNSDTPLANNIYLCFVIGSSITPLNGDFSFSLSGDAP